MDDNQKEKFNELICLFSEETLTTDEEHGFWENPVNDGEKLALVHSEISEALEEPSSK